MAQYFTTYNSREALGRQRRYAKIATFGIFALIAFNGVVGFKNQYDILDLKYHSHHQRNPAVSMTTSAPVNADGEYLYLSGAWF